MEYVSTRNKLNKVSGAQAIVSGLSAEGGLFVPETFPAISASDMTALIDMSYSERAAFIIAKFLPELSSELITVAESAYSRFDGDPAPLVKLDGNLYILELWHGPTHAFKDMALTVLPHLLTLSKKELNLNEHTLVLVATSGDTGKAALEGFKDVDSTSIAVLYPEDGVSTLQKLQMQTQEGNNVFVTAIKGNFDDAQTAVKKIFGDEQIKSSLQNKNIKLSSANSINWGRLVPQIVYYFSAYADLVSGEQIKQGDKINFCVPSGNFGNILAGWYAKQMGLPVNKLICASNKNNVLTDFFASGTYDCNRKFFKTSSPSMDILISSNLERLIFELSGRDDTLTAERMNQLKKKGTYDISDIELVELRKSFYAACSGDEEVSDSIAEFFEEYGYVMDTHTAVAYNVYTEYLSSTGDELPTVVVSTASPYKFVESVLSALGEKVAKDEVKNLLKLEDVSALPVPDSLINLPKMDKIYKGCVLSSQATDEILKFADKVNKF